MIFSGASKKANLKPGFFLLPAVTDTGGGLKVGYYIHQPGLVLFYNSLEILQAYTISI